MNRRSRVMAVLFFPAVCATALAIHFFVDLPREDVVPTDLYNVVYAQVNAFRAKDFSLAYSKASYAMRQKFSPAQFEKMIRRDYAEIRQADRIEFGIVKCRERHALIQVFFIGRDGSVLPCIYSLIYEGNEWKIDGARMLPREPAGAQFDEIRV